MNLRRVLLSCAFLLATSSAFALDAKSILADNNHVKMVVSPAGDVKATKIDLLLVIDDSGSMDSYQKLLSSRASEIAKVLKQGFSVQVAIVTTSMCSTLKSPKWPECTEGKFSGTPKIMKSFEKDFTIELEKNVLVGSGGSGDEEMFTPVIAALTPPLSENENKGFLRNDADLVVMFLTDGEDGSIVAPEAFIEVLEKIKGKDHFSIHGLIIPSASTSNCPRSGESKPVKLEQAIALTGGTTHVLCTANYTEVFEKISGSVKGYIERTIRLPFTPIRDSVTVNYGSYSLPRGDLRRGWVYDSVINALILGGEIDWATMPAADLVIEFDY